MRLADGLNAAARRVPTWPVYLAGLLLVLWYFWLGLTGGLGVEPIKGLEHVYGERALQFLIACLAITPLRRYLGINLIRFRRSIGLVAFFLVGAHLLVWLVLDVQIPSQIWADIVKRPYITIGMGAFVLMIPLAMTSNDRSVRRLGPKWRRLHKLTYVVVPLGALHFFLVRKGIQIEPLIYMAVIAGLLLLRLPRRRSKGRHGAARAGLAGGRAS